MDVRLAVLLGIFVLVFFSATASAEDIRIVVNGEGISKLYSAVNDAVTTLLDRLLSPASPIYQLLETFWLFFSFLILLITLVKIALNNADWLDFGIAVFWVFISGLLIQTPFGGQSSLYLYIVLDLFEQGLSLGSEVIRLLSGTDNSEVDAFIYGLTTRINMDVPWTRIDLGLFKVLVTIAWALFATVYFLVDVSIPIALAITLALGPFSVNLLFFNWGVNLAMNWLSMVLGWIFAIFTTKVIVAIAYTSFQTYIGFPAYGPDFWNVNEVFVELNTTGQIVPLFLMPIVFSLMLFSSIGWAQQLASAQLPSGSGARALGVAMLARRALGK